MMSSVSFDHSRAMTNKFIPGEIGNSYCESHWYAAHTNSRHEKLVAHQMEGSHIQCFLPLYKSVRRWKDRKKQVELPLFPGYVFVNIALRDKLQVLKLSGVVQLISFNGRPTPLPESEIEALRKGL